jgi:hypothetical protein
MLFQRIYSKLASLLDTSISSPTNGQALIYSTSQSRWINSTITAGSGDLLATNNLSDLASISTAVTNLGVLPLTGGTLTGNLNLGNNNLVFNTGNVSTVGSITASTLTANGGTLTINEPVSGTQQLNFNSHGSLGFQIQSTANSTNTLLFNSNSKTLLTLDYAGSVSTVNNILDDGTNGNINIIGSAAIGGNLQVNSQLSTNKNTLDDGSGNVIVSGTITGNLIGNVTGTAGSISGSITESQVTGLATSLAALSPIAGSTSVTTLGTITTGIWHGTALGPIYGGTGTNNGVNTITLNGNFSTQGTGNVVLVASGNTSVNLPTSGTLCTTVGSASIATVGTITTGTWNGTALAPAYITTVSTLTNSSGTVATNAALANVFELSITASGWTLSNPTNPTDGQKIIWRLIQGGSGSYTISWGTAFNWGSGSAPTLSTAVGKTDYVVGIYNGTTSKIDMVGQALTF